MQMREHLQFYDVVTGEYSKEFNDFYEDVLQYGAMNFDCNQVARAILDGLTPYQAAKQFDRDYSENVQKADWEDIFNHDMSMNY
jgi:hypothetical protein